MLYKKYYKSFIASSSVIKWHVKIILYENTKKAISLEDIYKNIIMRKIMKHKQNNSWKEIISCEKYRKHQVPRRRIKNNNA